MDPLVWPLILLLFGVALIFLEIFVPSGGVLSVLAGLAILASIIVGFGESFFVGTVILVVALIIIPIVVGAAIKWWPHTPFGRMVMINRPASQSEVLPNTREYRLHDTMIGKRGVAVSSLLPSGDVRIDGQIYDSVSAGMAIDPGQEIEVVDVRTQRLVVRPLSDEEKADKSETDDESDDILSTPIDSLGIDPFDDPLA
jgi:membrane-bound ClpP family serine protease